MNEKNVFMHYFTEFTPGEKNIIVKVESNTLYEPYKYHSHDFNELVIISGGTAIHKINDRETMLKKGDVFFITGDEKHGYSQCNKLRITNIMFKDEAIEPYLGSLKTIAGFQALFYSIPYYREIKNDFTQLTLNENDINNIDLLVEAMQACYDKKEPGYEVETVSYFLKIIIDLSNLYIFYENHVDLSITNISRAFTYIENHYLDDITISQLSSMANMSKRHFYRLFKEHFNISPHSYLINLRVNYAAFLLQYTDMRIIEISNLSKFNDSNYFTRCFKNHIGLSPSQYRQKVS